MKKLICTLLGISLLVTGLAAPSFVSAQGDLLNNDDSPFISETDPGGANEVNVLGTDEQQQDALVNVIKGWINWVLGIMALVALIIVIYGGILMVTAAGSDEQYKKGFTILKQAAIGLLVIGVSWFVVSLVFWLINVAGKPAIDSTAGTDQ